jgi:hypothetical protein
MSYKPLYHLLSEDNNYLCLSKHIASLLSVRLSGIKDNRFLIEAMCFDILLSYRNCEKKQDLFGLIAYNRCFHLLSKDNNYLCLSKHIASLLSVRLSGIKDNRFLIEAMCFDILLSYRNCEKKQDLFGLIAYNRCFHLLSKDNNYICLSKHIASLLSVRLSGIKDNRFLIEAMCFDMLLSYRNCEKKQDLFGLIAYNRYFHLLSKDNNYICLSKHIASLLSVRLSGIKDNRFLIEAMCFDMLL